MWATSTPTQRGTGGCTGRTLQQLDLPINLLRHQHGYNSLKGSERPFSSNFMDNSGYGHQSFERPQRQDRRLLANNPHIQQSDQGKTLRLGQRKFIKGLQDGFQVLPPTSRHHMLQYERLDSRWGWNNFNRNAYSPGSFGVYCSNAGSNSRKFNAIVDMYYTTSSSRPNYSNGDSYEFTFYFNSVSDTTKLLQLQEDHGLQRIQLQQHQDQGLLPARRLHRLDRHQPLLPQLRQGDQVRLLPHPINQKLTSTMNSLSY